MGAPGKAGPGHAPGEAELLHARLGRIVRTSDDIAKAIEVIAKVRRRRRARTIELHELSLGPHPWHRLCRREGRGRAENLLLLGLVDLEPASGMPVASFPLEGAERAQEAGLVLDGLDGHHPIQELRDACGAGAGNELFREAGEHRAPMVVEKARELLLLPARALRCALEGCGTRRRYRSGEAGRKALQDITAPDPGGRLSRFLVRCQWRRLPRRRDTLP